MEELFKKGMAIFWRWKRTYPTAYSKAYICDVIETDNGIMLELSDSMYNTSIYRLKANEIDIEIVKIIDKA